MIFVIASNEIKPECRAEYIRIAKENIPTVRQEKGCIGYTLTKDASSGMPAQVFSGENTLTFVECWESLDALKAHLASPHMKIFAEKTRPMKVKSSLRIAESV